MCFHHILLYLGRTVKGSIVNFHASHTGTQNFSISTLDRTAFDIFFTNAIGDFSNIITGPFFT